MKTSALWPHSPAAPGREWSLAIELPNVSDLCHRETRKDNWPSSQDVCIFNMCSLNALSTLSTIKKQELWNGFVMVSRGFNRQVVVISWPFSLAPPAGQPLNNVPQNTVMNLNPSYFEILSRGATMRLTHCSYIEISRQMDCREISLKKIVVPSRRIVITLTSSLLFHWEKSSRRFVTKSTR